MDTQEVEDQDWGKAKEQFQVEHECMQAKTRNLEGIKEGITKITGCSKEVQEETDKMIQDLKILQDQVAKVEREVVTELEQGMREEEVL